MINFGSIRYFKRNKRPCPPQKSGRNSGDPKVKWPAVYIYQCPIQKDKYLKYTHVSIVSCFLLFVLEIFGNCYPQRPFSLYFKFNRILNEIPLIKIS